MAIPRTSLLDLPLPVTGSLSGDWGAATNNGLTEYLDIAVAGSLVLNTDADVTLTSTDGDENGTNIGSTTAQYAILRWTATGSTTRNITVPAKSKTYIVINATGGTQSIVLRGAGPTTGVTIVSGEKAVCAWNGSDFVKVGGAAGGTNTQVQYNNNGVFGGVSGATTNGTAITFSTTNLKLQGSSTGVSSFASANSSATDYTVTFPAASTTIPVATQTLTFSGPTAARTITLPDANFTAARTDSAQTFTGVQTFSSNPILSGGTANGVLYLNGSSVATSGSALSWSGSALGIGQASASSSGFSTAPDLLVYNASTANIVAAGDSVSAITSARYIDTTGGGILRAAKYRGTYASPTVVQSGDTGGEVRFEVWGGSNLRRIATVSGVVETYTSDTNISGYLTFNTTPAGSTTPSEKMRLDSSGNLGLGVAPSASASVDCKQIALGGLNYLSGTASSGAGSQNFYTGLYYNAYQTGQSSFNAIKTNSGDDWKPVAYVQIAGQHRWLNASSATAGSAITFTQAMTLDASGNLGVGATSPTSVAGYKTIETQGSSGGIFQTSASGNTVKARFYSTSTSGYVGTNSNDPFAVITNDTERVHITSGGTFLIGNGETAASPSAGILSATGGTGTNIAGANLTIRGGASTGSGAGGAIIFSTAAAGASGTTVRSASERARITSGGYFKASDNGTYQNSTGSFHEFYQTANSVALDIKATNASYDQSVCFLRTDRAASSVFQFLFCHANGSGQFYVRGDGTIYAQNTTVQSISDVRVKENIRNSSDGLNVINAIRPVRFDFKPGFGNDRKNQLGFIAQEIETVFPDAVENISLSDGKDESYKSVGPGALIPVLVKAIQEQQALITSLTARVAALEGTQP